MRTLKLHFPDDALSTLDTFLKQTKEARVFRRAQAVRNVVKGQRLQTVSDALSPLPIPPCASGSIALPTTARRVSLIARARGDRLKLPASWNSTSIVSSIKTLQHGSLYSQWSCRELATVLAQQTGVQLGRESVRCVLKKRTCYYRPTGRLDPAPADLAYGSLELAALEYQARRRDHLFALRRRDHPVALCPAPCGLVAQSAARSPPYTSAESESNQTRGGPETPDLVTLPLLEPHHQRGAALGPRRCAVWHLQSLL